MNVRKNKLYRAKHLMATGALLLASGLVATSCIDSSFDLDEDIDMTMGFGADGLSVKLGSTGKVYLDDILDIDKNVKLDGSNVYYLVEEGSTNVDFKVNAVMTTIKNATLHADQELVNFGDVLPAGVPSMTIPGNWSLSDVTVAGQTDDFTFHLSNIPSEVQSLSTIYPMAGTRVSLSLKLEATPNVKAKITQIKDLKVTMPDYLRIKSVSQGTFKGNVISIPNVANPGTGEFCRVEVECIDLGEDGNINGNDELVLPVEKSRIKMSGKFTVGAKEAFTVTANDNIRLSMDILLGSGVSGQEATVTIDKVVGKFNPDINPTIESINIQDQLPDFLQDDEVRIVVANPTLRFDVDMTQIPLSLNFSGKLIAHKGDAANDKTVVLPETGKAEFLKNKQNYVYFSQESTPYDPTGLIPFAAKHKVSNLGTLIEQLPDFIKVDVSNGQIKVKDEMATIQLDRNYNASLGYKIFVPFQFNSGLKIVYRDSTNSLNDDLEDYQAEGLVVKATAYSTVPLDLNATIYPVDVNGNEIPGIQVETVIIQASNDGATEKATELEISCKLTNPKDLQKVDRFLFRVGAEANQSNLSLNSKQYLRFENVRLKLTGQVIADFN
ncbi:MAG: hypothetical protein PUF09_03660 [Bacteroidales bacterium]|nr:hypothetical protein [Bacteroidales bacterium]